MSKKRGVWEIYAWFWEPDVTPDVAMVEALWAAAERFVAYLGAEYVKVDRRVEARARAALNVC